MSKWLVSVALASAFLSGCASVPRGSIPVQDSSGSLLTDEQGAFARRNGGSAPVQARTQEQSLPQDSGVVVMVPGGVSSAPLETYPDGSSGTPATYAPAPLSTGPIAGAAGYQAPAAPSMWPVIDLVELTAMRRASSPNTALIALVSLRSLAGVDVPCALM